MCRFCPPTVGLMCDTLSFDWALYVQCLAFGLSPLCNHLFPPFPFSLGSPPSALLLSVPGNPTLLPPNTFTSDSFREIFWTCSSRTIFTFRIIIRWQLEPFCLSSKLGSFFGRSSLNWLRLLSLSSHCWDSLQQLNPINCNSLATALRAKVVR